VTSVLFNSAIFIFVFLPITLAVYYGLNALRLDRMAIGWLVVASAVFYGWFSVRYLAMLAVLIVFNYVMGVLLARDFHAGRRRPALLALGVGINLAVLGYFKYTNFFIDNLNVLFGSDFVLRQIILPIGISFFTFQKIAYLVDAYRGETEEYDFLDFSLFVMYFPQLIAGPIVHHKEMIPQFVGSGARRFNAQDLAAGLVLFTIGLIKKAVFADTLVGLADPIFAAAQARHIPSLYDAWSGVLAFTLQIYFDFSGYTDMALGLALMMSIRLPLNFNSPYQTTNIIDFWRRWHMTLSRFLRDYLYIPLGGNRRGERRRFVNLMLTMLIGGLWHGAAWTFVAWGALHGIYLIINHAWLRVGGALRLPLRGTAAARGAAWLITFLAVAVAWVFFRSESFAAAVTMLRGMAGRGGLGAPSELSYVAQQLVSVFSLFGFKIEGRWLTLLGVFGRAGMVGILLAAVAFLPNSQQMLAGLRPALQKVMPSRLGRWLGHMLVSRPFLEPDGSLRLTALTGFIFAGLFLAALAWQTMRTTSLQPFIYFQF
jgi:D-alanyl-lipoteichoic acid acyltransferase DltB (MBOAT superfamily)